MNTLSPAEETTRQRNLQFFTTPRLWLAWPFLPLVRRKPGEKEEYGLLFDAKGFTGQLGLSASVFLSNLFMMPATLDDFLNLPKETFDLPEEVFAAGWRVD
jgi:hypothetical protein